MSSSAEAGYVRRFSALRTDKSRSRWPAATRNRAPHKPLLLLSVLDLFDAGAARDNLVELAPELGESFARYWETVFPFERRGNLALPFFHLQSEGFWHLLPKKGKEEAMKAASQIRTLSGLRDTVLGARLDEALHELLQVREARERLRAVLVETYFAAGTREALEEQIATNHQAVRYSNELLKLDGEAILRETLSEEYRPAVRDQGFRRAVVTAYAHRCALCAIRMRTLDGHTVVDAAHIVPWRVGRDDRPSNGMALCRTCHWSFDEGLLRVSPTYEILASDQLAIVGNLPGYLTTLEGRGIVRPASRAHWPDPRSLEWHHEKVFRS